MCKGEKKLSKLLCPMNLNQEFVELINRHQVKRLSALFLIILLSAFSCQNEQSKNANRETSKGSINNPVDEVEEFIAESFSSSAWEKGEVLLIYGDVSAELTPKYEALAKQLQGSLGKRIKLLAKPFSKVSDSELDTSLVCLIGTTKSNPLIAEFALKTPFEITDKGFQFSEMSFHNPSDFFMVGVYPNPRNPTISMSMIVGNSDKELLNAINAIYGKNWRGVMRNNWGYQVYSQGKKVMLGKFAMNSNTTWEIDSKAHWDFTKQAEMLEETTHFKLIKHGEVNPKYASGLLPMAEQTISEIEEFVGKQFTGKINYHAYSTAEIKGLLINDITHSNVDFDNLEVNIIVNEEYEGNHLQSENKLVFRQLLGKPKLNVLEIGLSVRFANKWQKLGHEFWASRLYQSGNLVPISELVDNELFDKESRLVFDCMAGVFVDFLLQEWGKETFLKKYASWQPTPAEIEKLQKSWEDFIPKNIIPENDSVKKLNPTIPDYFKGFNFAHEGYQVYDGYGSEEATNSLKRLESIGTNAVAIVPYSSMGDPNKPNFLRLSNWAGGETDESVVHSAFEAKKLGMHVLLKPQIWLGRGSWPGDVEMKSEADWKLFFDYYNRWTRHYAMLAEIHEMDMFCIGVEFAKVTLAKPQKWMDLAHSTRKIYTGKLTYAANWGEEAENAKIWSAFDYIGINCYYPLSKSANPTQTELNEAFGKTMKMLKNKSSEYNMPIVFTEIGFRSIEEPWKQPHAEANGADYNESSQANCYQAVFENLPENRDWCKGVFWWKWPSYMGYAKKNAKSFAPTNKLSEKIIYKNFSKL
ncbi:MAG: hypothetical protein ACI85I_001043 [Arenicella sp.]